MSQYKVGTITVTSGSSTVTGTGTAFVTAGIAVNDLLVIGTTGSVREPIGFVASVINETTLILQSAWAGNNYTNAVYGLHRDFEPFTQAPLMVAGDINTDQIFNRAVTKVVDYIRGPAISGAINVKFYGAIGNGIFDNTAIFNQVLNLGGIIFVPPGIYNITSTLNFASENTYLLLDPAATIQFNVANNTVCADIKASNIMISGGKLKSLWDLSLNGTDSVDSSRDGVILFRVRPPVLNGSPIRNICIHNSHLTRIGGYVLRASFNGTASYSEIVVRNCIIEENYNALQFESSDPGTSNITVLDNMIVTTAGPATTTKNSMLGANAISFVGPFSAVRIEGNVIADCGRMGIEMFLNSSSLEAGYSNKNVVIKKNNIASCTYRSVSLGVIQLDFSNNNIHGTTQGWDYLEAAGAGHFYSNNTFTGTGFIGVPPNSTWKSNGLELLNNYWSDIPNSEAGAIKVTQWTNVTFRGNRALFAAAVKSGQPKTPCFDFISNSHLVFDSNDVALQDPCDRELLLQNQLHRGGSISNNIFRLNISNAVLYSVMWLAGLEAVQLINNRTFAMQPTVFTSSYGSVAGLGAGYSGLWRYQTDGTTWTKTACASGALQNDPPGSPATNAIYVVGDNPTGAWVGNARTFAQWSGSAWTYSAILDILLHSETRGLPLSEGQLPIVGNSGDAYLLTESGLIKCVVSANDVAAGKSIKGITGQTGWITAYEGQSTTLIWKSEFYRNSDYVRLNPSVAFIINATVELYPLSSPPVSGYHEKGTRVLNLYPSDGDPTAWVCSSAGSPGTWRGFGAIGGGTDLVVTGNTTLGDSGSDTITLNGRVASDILFSSDATRDIGQSSSNRPRNIFLTRDLEVGRNISVAGEAYFTNLMQIAGPSAQIIFHENDQVAPLGKWKVLAAFGGDFTLQRNTSIEGDFSTSTNPITVSSSDVCTFAADIVVQGELKTSQATLMRSTVSLTNGEGTQVGTLTNAPAAGNPIKWILINDNGTILKVPAWSAS